MSRLDKFEEILNSYEGRKPKEDPIDEAEVKKLLMTYLGKEYEEQIDNLREYFPIMYKTHDAIGQYEQDNHIDVMPDETGSHVKMHYDIIRGFMDQNNHEKLIEFLKTNYRVYVEDK